MVRDRQRDNLAAANGHATLRFTWIDLTRYADRYDFAFVDDAAHFITDDAPDEVTALALDWFEHA